MYYVVETEVLYFKMNGQKMTLILSNAEETDWKDLGPEQPFGRKNGKYGRPEVQRSLLCAKTRKKVMAGQSPGESREQAGATSHRAAQATVRACLLLCEPQESTGGLYEGESVLCSTLKVITWRRKCGG